MHIIYFSIFGLLIGSFLNVVIWRVPLKMSVSQPSRSFCPKCETQLLWWENIPVISWLILKAKCRTCQAPISGRYPFVEILSGMLAAFCGLKFGVTPTGILLYFFSATLLAITFIDFDHKIIPNVISFPGMTFGLFLGCFNQYTTFFESPLTNGACDSLLGLIAGGGFFWLVSELYYLLKGAVGLGGGDIKLTAMIGAILGVESIIPTIFAASLIGAPYGVAVILIKGSGRNTEIPFGPFLALGALIFIFFDLPLLRILPK